MDSPDDDAIFEPTESDHDAHAEHLMMQGRVDISPSNSLRDTWFTISAGREWLAQHESEG